MENIDDGKFIRMEVKDGKSAFFWLDNWLQLGKLIDITGAVGTQYLSIPRNARVCEAVSHEQWNVRGHRRRHYHALHERIQRELIPDAQQGSDMVLWKHSDDDFKPWFSSLKTWEQIREKEAMVPWSRAVWFTQGVPRYTFIVWLAVRNRLSTGDRMRAWGIQQSYVLCGERDETRDKLAGRFSGNITDPDWTSSLQLVNANNLQLLDRILLKMVFQTSIYHIWQERNQRRHRTVFRSVDQLIRTVDKAIRNRITSLCYKSGHELAG
ncbi:hypothetical protein F2Q69_00052658 [Brassica cretica]|uniref:Reverse transcriptase zinc-binding domain-containing protein n=1 Tax=Brassica cretica TaxID=69181 RepID=A0A8S9N4H8_BRACR|nr:hypothetical protein F2Q69_00052658 [Brassica cretica]